MTPDAGSRSPAHATPRTPAAPTLRAESEALLTAFIAGGAGAVVGIILTFVARSLALWSPWGLGSWAAICGAVAAGVSSALGFWRSRTTDGQEWRQDISDWRYVISTVSVMIAHVALTAIGILSLFALLARAFIGVEANGFWTVTLLAVLTGLSGYLSYLSASRMTTQRLTSLLVSFIGIGSLAAMVTTSDPQWWELHFSQLGTFGDLSSFLFNGTLVAGGLLVTTFTLFVDRDLRAVGDGGSVPARRAVTTALVVMGVMLACVGIFPVDVNLLLHNLSASGMALMYLVLLAGGPWLLRGMPRTYFLASWAFLAALVASIVLFAVGYFGLTAFEIVVFALIFGWLAVFIRFLSAARTA
ncbi:hypothetical protein LJR045_000161 [Microbacterium sp. LjRoot45]|uniref:hypothetical protein n=1 Tax=Microbacterium sp. LjRoot45 TaxID=3342329 RepID=UPI003ED0B69E